MKGNFAKLQLLSAMGIFGTIGIVRYYIPMPAAAVACLRGVIGVAFLLILMLLTGRKPDLRAIGKKLWLLCLSGGAIGFNWVLLFEGYRYSVPTATVCYYMAPVFMILASPLVGEKLSAKKLACVAVALAGMVLVSGLQTKGEILYAVLLGLGAAVLYASVILMNRGLGTVGSYDRTVVQLSAAALVLVPYVLLTEGFGLMTMNVTGWILLVVLGIVHTGVAYAMYFGAMGHLSTQTVAIFSYLDPILAIILSAVILKQGMDGWQIVGAVLVLGSALYSELPDRKKPKD